MRDVRGTHFSPGTADHVSFECCTCYLHYYGNRSCCDIYDAPTEMVDNEWWRPQLSTLAFPSLIGRA